MNVFGYYILPIFVSIALHAVVVVALMHRWDPSSEPRVVKTPKYIEAKLVELKPKSKNKATAKKKPKIVDLAAKRREQERLNKIAEKKRQQKIANKKAADAKRAADKKKKEQAQERKRQQEKQLAEQRRQQLLQQEFEQALQEEQGLLLNDEFATEAASYAAKIRQRIEQKWSRPPSARNGMRCELTIDLVPTGQVVDVNIKSSSGNSAFDRSAIAAVKRIESFPEIKEMPIAVFERNFRKFTLVFQPEDLRQ